MSNESIKNNAAALFFGPCATFTLMPIFLAQSRVSKVKGIKRIILSPPAVAAGIVPTLLYPLALILDRLVKPIFFSLDRDSKIDSLGKPLTTKSSLPQKIKNWALVFPRLLGVLPLAALMTAVTAVAMPILFIPIVIYTMAGKSLQEQG